MRHGSVCPLLLAPGRPAPSPWAVASRVLRAHRAKVTAVISERVEIPNGVDEAWQLVNEVLASLGRVEQAIPGSDVTGSVRYGLNRVRLRVSVVAGPRPGSSVADIEAHDRQAAAVASRIVVDRLIERLIGGVGLASPNTDPEPGRHESADPEVIDSPESELANRGHPGLGFSLGEPRGAAIVATNVGVADELGKLADLRDRGVLSDAEFAAQKAALLSDPRTGPFGVGPLGVNEPAFALMPPNAPSTQWPKGTRPLSRWAALGHVVVLLISTCGLVAALGLPRRPDQSVITIARFPTPSGLLAATIALFLGTFVSVAVTPSMRRWHPRWVGIPLQLTAWAAFLFMLATGPVVLTKTDHVLPVVVIRHYPFVAWTAETAAGLLAAYSLILAAAAAARSRVVTVAVLVGALFGVGYWRAWPVAVAVSALGVALVAACFLGFGGVDRRVRAALAHLRLPGIGAGTGGATVAVILATTLVVVPAAFEGVGAVAENLANKTIALKVHVDGDVAVAAPLTAATVRIYRLSGSGRLGRPVGTATTDPHGHYMADVSRKPGDFLLVVATGGRYLDEITGKAETTGPTGKLETVITPGTTFSSVTPLTTMATSRALTLAAENKPLNLSVETSFAAVAQAYDLTSITDVYPDVADTSPLQQPVTPTFEDRQTGLVLSGLDQEANTLGTNDLSLSDALATATGANDSGGSSGAAPVLINGSTPLPSNASTSMLQHAISQFAGSPANQTGIPAPQISPAPVSVSADFNSLYVTAPQNINFQDGTAGRTSISASGGSGPGTLTCTLVAGSLPAHTTLSPDCVVAYDGSPLVGDSAYIAYPPFSVKITDQSHPPKSVTVNDLRINMLHAPPRVVGHKVACNPAPNPSCLQPNVLAEAEGGLPLYTFDTTPLAPFGLKFVTINTASSGVGRGTFGDIDGNQLQVEAASTGSSLGDLRQGSYPIQVCAIDSAGFTGCDNAEESTVTVGPISSQPWNLDVGGYSFEPGTCLSNGSCTFFYHFSASGLTTVATIDLQITGSQVSLSGNAELSGTVSGTGVSATGAASISGQGRTDAPFPDSTGASGSLTLKGSVSVGGISEPVNGTYNWTAKRVQ